MRVLDIGGGLGGPARTLASNIGCPVEVLDLTEEFCTVGRELTKRTGLSDLVSFTHGNALDMPFSSNSFDAVWTQHSTMNISDKSKLYSEICRILKPGGTLTMHEVFAVEGQDIHFPVPWARDETMSHLITQEKSRSVIAANDLDESTWTDETAKTTRWFLERATAMPSEPPPTPPLGLHLVLGSSFREMFGNQVKNLAEERITVARAVFELPAH